MRVKNEYCYKEQLGAEERGEVVENGMKDEKKKKKKRATVEWNVVDVVGGDGVGDSN
jgi:hypothetical protein